MDKLTTSQLGRHRAKLGVLAATGIGLLLLAGRCALGTQRNQLANFR